MNDKTRWRRITRKSPSIGDAGRVEVRFRGGPARVGLLVAYPGLAQIDPGRAAVELWLDAEDGAEILEFQEWRPAESNPEVEEIYTTWARSKIEHLKAAARQGWVLIPVMQGPCGPSAPPAPHEIQTQPRILKFEFRGAVVRSQRAYCILCGAVVVESGLGDFGEYRLERQASRIRAV